MIMYEPIRLRDTMAIARNHNWISVNILAAFLVHAIFNLIAVDPFIEIGSILALLFLSDLISDWKEWLLHWGCNGFQALSIKFIIQPDHIGAVQWFFGIENNPLNNQTSFAIWGKAHLFCYGHSRIQKSKSPLSPFASTCEVSAP